MAISEEWTDPDSLEISVGDLPRASWANALLGNILYNYGGPRVTVARNTDLPVDDGQFTTVPWETVLTETPDGAWWDSGSPGALVVPRDGVYLVSVRLLWDSNSEGRRDFRLLRDGDPVAGDKRPALQFVEIGSTLQVTLNQGQSLACEVRQTSGETHSLLAEGPVATSTPYRSPIMQVRWDAPTDGG